MKLSFYFFPILLLALSGNLFSQDSTALVHGDGYSLSFIVEVYYSKSVNKASDTINIARFSVGGKFVDEFRLNNLRMYAKYNKEKIRANFTLQVGDIPELLAFPQEQFMKFINVANLGYSPLKDFWLDAGYLPDPIGYESSSPYFNQLTMISVGGYYEPSNFIGIRASYDFSPKVSASIFYGNPYTLRFGRNKHFNLQTSLTVKPVDQIFFQYSTLFGNQQTVGNDPKLNQFYNNFILTYSPFDYLNFVGQFDFAMQTNSKTKVTGVDTTLDWAYMVSGFLQAQYFFLPNFSITGRAQLFSDPDGFLTGNLYPAYYTSTASYKGMGMNLYGFTVGLEYKPYNNFYIRGEYTYEMTDKGQNVFNGLTASHRHTTLFSAGVKF